MPYATRQDIYDLGLAAQAFVRLPRPLESYGSTDIDPTTGTIRLVGHGLSASDLIYLTVTIGGAIPGGAATLTYYSPIVLGADLLQLATMVGGSTPLTFSSAGKGWSIAVDPARRLDAHLVETAAQIDQHLTAHAPPILVDPVTGKYPQILVGLNARMAARSAAITLEITNAAYKTAFDRLFAQEETDRQLLEQLQDGVPLLPRPTDEDDIADNAARAGASRRPVPWSTGCL